MPAKLPPELIDLIVQHSEETTLSACCAAHRDFLAPCRRRRFSNIRLKTLESYRSWINLAAGSPASLAHARELSILPQPYLWLNGGSDQGIPELLALCTNLKKLGLSSNNNTNGPLDWTRFSPELRTALSGVLGLSTVTHVSLAGVCNFPLDAFWSFGPNLRHLEIVFVGFVPPACGADDAESLVGLTPRRNNCKRVQLDSLILRPEDPTSLNFIDFVDYVLSPRSLLDLTHLVEFRAVHCSTSWKILEACQDSLQRYSLSWPPDDTSLICINEQTSAIQNLKSLLSLNLCIDQDSDIPLVAAASRLLGACGLTTIQEVTLVLGHSAFLERNLDGWSELDAIASEMHANSLRKVNIDFFIGGGSPYDLLYMSTMHGRLEMTMPHVWSKGIVKHRIVIGSRERRVSTFDADDAIYAPPLSTVVHALVGVYQ